MKKFLAALAIAGTLVACNNNADSTTKTDSTTVKSDTSSKMMSTPAVDSTKMDTTHKMSTMDTTHKMTTTVTTTKKDSVKKK